MPGALYTDLYELNMAASYLGRGMNDPATFSLFVRRLPPRRRFLVAAGLEDCLSFLEDFRFTAEDLAFIRDGLGFGPAAVEALAGVRFTGDVWAVPEGRIVHAQEPLLEVTAPIAQGQLVETYLLNQVTFQTAIASKAARCRIAAGPAGLVDFSFRRTQGGDAAMAVARSSAIAGFVGTSNVEAARRYGLTASGTMAHSYVAAFPTESDAFRAFARDFPGRTTFLVDTYDTPSGVRAAIGVINELGLTEGLAIRLDSGDLDALSRRARDILDSAGLPQVRIFASGGLDETDIARLVGAGAPIDAYGVGTRMGVSADAPYLDTAYKLVEFAGRPIQKLSAQKATLPGAKQTFRGRDEDVIGLRDEAAPPGHLPLLEPVMIAGERTAGRTGAPAEVSGAQRRFLSDLEALSPELLDLSGTGGRRVLLSPALRRLDQATRARLLRQPAPG